MKTPSIHFLIDNNRLIIQGELTFSTTPLLFKEGRTWMRQATSDVLTIDLDAVTQTDSAALALLIEWIRAARQENKQITFLNIPQQLKKLAETSHTEGLLKGDLSL
ncbi:MAG: hypothetical protein A2X77_00335 [Gammaproteobacteria bacterium GWE2_42_36]|nr:MAG: hypothetical protein A2X77_00335 [Gammaproteobacteria bacterium GWE2_42_36]HCU05261.1 anti-anti-sigma factor [Coxiellaceae bacterium]